MTYDDNPKLKLAAAYIQSTNTHVFLTGKAGTGKTTFLRSLKNLTFKRFVVVAPTGVAAINAGGVTIHSFFQLPFGPQIPESEKVSVDEIQSDAKMIAARFQKFTREKINIIRSLDLLVIDEISMVRADLLDAIDMVLRRYKDQHKAFGGVQLLMIGDLQQLAPIARDEDWELLKNYYDSVYFFSSRALKHTHYVSIELDRVYRQSDHHFISLLNNIRNGNPDAETIQELNQRYQPDFVETNPENFITLTTHNNQANGINQSRLQSLKTKPHHFEAIIKGDFPEYLYPTHPNLELKIGAQVMFVKNDPSPMKAFYNGKIGVLTDIDHSRQTLSIQCEGDEFPIETGPLEWQNARYTLNEKTKEIEEDVIGSFKQYPVKLAWAITIHKSQGLTFDKAIIDAQSAFAHGQVYVALSRCRTLEGLVFRTQIPVSAFRGNSTIGSFMQKVEEEMPDQISFEKARHGFQLELLQDVFDFHQAAKQWGFLIKLSKENEASLEKRLPEQLRQFSIELRTSVTEVADRFIVQLKKLAHNCSNLEDDSQLNERLKRAAEYFSPLLAKRLSESEMEIETDNKVVKKSLQEALARFHQTMGIHIACIELLKNGFSLTQLLEVKAKASIIGKSQTKKPPGYSHQKTGGFYQTLKKWRNAKAEEMDVAYHQVLPSRTMKEISEVMPESVKDLAKIHGMGKMRIKHYSEEILELLSAYFAEQNIPGKIEPGPPEAEAEKPQKVSSHYITLEMLLEGKSIETIAAERGMTISTIEHHISRLIRLGKLEPADLMPKERIELIAEYFTEVDDQRLGPAKEVLGEEISYGELRWVLTWLEVKGIVEKIDKTL